MDRKSLTLMVVGDVTLEKPNGEFYLSKVAPVLRTGDIVVGNGEIVFSEGIPTYVEVSGTSPGCPPENIGAIASAGFHLMTLGTNHVYDRGAQGIEETIAGFKQHGIAVVGAGMNIDEARQPAIIERDGTCFGFLNYNCVGPKGQWATIIKPGCAYVDIVTYYENINNPGGAPDVYTFAEKRSLSGMIDDIQKLRPLCDILVVIFHKGIRLSPKLAMYDQEVTHAAIDAGADLILGHHTLMKGIEWYNGKAIFHGLGLFCPVAKGSNELQMKAKLTFHNPNVSDILFARPYPAQYPAAQLVMIAKCIIDDKKISRVSYLPCLVNSLKQPEVLKNDERGQQAIEFMREITKEAGLNTRYQWKGDEIVIHAD